MSKLETINLLNTMKGSEFENVFPKQWDWNKIDYCCSRKPEQVYEREAWWHKDFRPVGAKSLEDFNTIMGHEIAMQIKLARDNGQDIVMIWSVGPMGMYRWAVEFLKQWNVDCSHVHGFNMDEWSDSEGNTLPSSNPGAFRNAMESALYGPLGDLTVPEKQRHFATKKELPTFADRIGNLRAKGARLSSCVSAGCSNAVFGTPLQRITLPMKRKKATHRIGITFIRSRSSRTRSPASRAECPSYPLARTRSTDSSSVRTIRRAGGRILPCRNMIYQGRRSGLRSNGPNMDTINLHAYSTGQLMFIDASRDPEPEVN